ncbi:hypothetical protein EKO03_23100 [Enterobacter quasiroggenkampii]|jgi:hypothetical protein|uniref:hypothetical protein n=1 Tax=Enterobacter quasiroggenkampii TaxID=2497436 RepID=UPI000F8227B6|nr:hypothetical protein [Enterobacter quasiroggenkampii]RTM73057.1 hypothetical protein EKO03_23100 [Enterobacter quasiroggenkampii]
MMLFDNGYQELARNVVGRKLQNVNGLIYIYNVPDLGAPQQLQFFFFVKIKMLCSDVDLMGLHLN